MASKWEISRRGRWPYPIGDHSPDLPDRAAYLRYMRNRLRWIEIGDLEALWAMEDAITPGVIERIDTHE